MQIPSKNSIFISCLIICCSLMIHRAYPQNVNKQLLKSYTSTSSTQQPKRSFLANSKPKNFGKLFVGSLLFIYQNVFSEQISAQCTYQISCSEYTKRCIEKHGILIGSIQGFHQFMHCTPNAHEEVPEYMKSNLSSKIQNHVD